jgi:F-box protein 21
MRGNLVDLPDEILHLILLSSPPSQCVALEQTARRFRAVTNSPLLWRHYCTTAFRYWDDSHDIKSKLKQPPSTVHWKQLFAQRRVTDRETTRALDDILANRVGRIRKAQDILDRGYDVKDTLVRHAGAGLEGDDYLARRYFSEQILGCLRRSIAIAEWAKLREGEDTISLERALGSFDLFVPQCEIDSLDEVSLSFPYCLLFTV